MDDEGDAAKNEDEVDYFKQAASLLEEDAGEEGHTDWSDRGNHGHVCYGKIPETQNSMHTRTKEPNGVCSASNIESGGNCSENEEES